MAPTFSLNGDYSLEFIQYVAMAGYLKLVDPAELSAMLASKSLYATPDDVGRALKRRIVLNRKNYKPSK